MKAPWSQPVLVSGPFLNSAYASNARFRIFVLPICMCICGRCVRAAGNLGLHDTGVNVGWGRHEGAT